MACVQCFDTTDPKEVTKAFLESTRKNLDTGTFGASSLKLKSDDPVWDSATLSYRQAFPLVLPARLLMIVATAAQDTETTNARR